MAQRSNGGRAESGRPRDFMEVAEVVGGGAPECIAEFVEATGP